MVLHGILTDGWNETLELQRPIIPFKCFIFYFIHVYTCTHCIIILVCRNKNFQINNIL